MHDILLEYFPTISITLKTFISFSSGTFNLRLRNLIQANKAFLQWNEASQVVFEVPLVPNENISPKRENYSDNEWISCFIGVFLFRPVSFTPVELNQRHNPIFQRPAFLFCSQSLLLVLNSSPIWSLLDTNPIDFPGLVQKRVRTRGTLTSDSGNCFSTPLAKSRENTVLHSLVYSKL